ncbi:VOC family protein [Pseudofrankia saprophytica]|uniref:VOC family protein n=1 Tax=Pseudofrankia saprophytica TaxID=298655 RepID=UPI000234C73F|nr:VOC family protein [Pseudofrankia saprophytica]
MNQTPAKIVCFSHLGITVTDISASVDFYTRILGLVRRFTDERDGWTRVGLEVNGTMVELFSPHVSADLWHSIDPFYPKDLGRPKIALTVADAAATYQSLIEAGITPLCPVTTTRVSAFFFIADPDGTPIQLQEFLDGQQRVAELFA